MMTLPESAKRASSTEYQCFCPTCHRFEYYLNPYKEAGHCKRGKCDTRHYTKQELYEAFGIDPDEDDWKGLAPLQQPKKVERGYELTGLIPAWLAPLGQAYLKGRGLDESITQRGRIEWSQKLQRFVTMLDPCTEDLQPRQATRKPGKIGKWYPAHEGISLNEYWYGMRDIPDRQQNIIIMEGVFDVLATRMLGRGIAMMGTEMTLSGMLLLRRRFQRGRAVVWVDPDKAGTDFKSYYVPKLTTLVREVVVLEEQDPKFLRPDRRPADARLLESINRMLA